MGQIPLVAAFAEKVKRRYQPARPDTFWECEPLLRYLADPQLAETIVNDSLRQLLDARDGSSDWHLGEMLLAEDRNDRWRLRLRLLTAPTRYLRSVPRPMLVAAVGGLDLHGQRYTMPAGMDPDVFDPALQLQPDARYRVAAGSVLRMEAGGPAHDHAVSEPLLLLVFEGAPVHALQWYFSRDTLHAWLARDTDPADADLKAALWLSGRLAHQQSLAPVLALTRHGNPGVRWAALEQLSRFSRSEAQRRLEQACADASAAVRSAAARLLDREDFDRTKPPTSWFRWR